MLRSGYQSALEGRLKLKVNREKSALARPWKRPATRLKKLRSLGIHDNRAYISASSKGPWHCAGTPALIQALTPEFFTSLGLYGLTEHFDAMRTTST